MNLSKKINILWIIFGATAFGFAAYKAIANNCWGPLIGFAIGAFVGIVFARRSS